MIYLFIEEFKDRFLRDNFDRLSRYINSEPLLKGEFKFFEFSLSAASYPSTVSFRHNLEFVPKDVIVTSKKDSGNYTLEFDQFDQLDIKITIDGPVTLRTFIGAYSEGRTV